MSRKGISPILASVLLLAATLAVAGIFTGWAPNLVQTVTEATEDQTEHRIECDRASLEMVSSNYNGSAVETALRNNGQMDLPDITLAVFNEGDSLIAQETNITLDSGQLSDETVHDVDEDPGYVNAYSGNCGSVDQSIEVS